MTDLITRYLEALSAIPVERDEAVHYIYQLPDGNLIKKSFFQDWSLPDFIGPAKPGTSVAYYLDDERELVICLNESNVLQDYQLSDDEEWILGGLSDLGFVAAPGTELSITKHEDNLYLYCQDKSSGAVRELICSDSSSGAGMWEASGELSVASPIKDTSISAVTKAGRIHVFYVHLDRSIHQCIYEGNSWIDDTTGKLEDGSLPVRIAASVDNGCLNVFYKTETGDIVALEEQGRSRRKIGIIGADGVFVSSAGGGDREERFMANVLNAQICAIM